MHMTECRIFNVLYTRKDGSGGGYSLNVDPWTTLDLAWASQKCWFAPGSVVTITDDKHNTKTFIKEN